MNVERTGVVLEHKMLTRDERLCPGSVFPWPSHELAVKSPCIRDDVDNCRNKHERDQQQRTLFARNLPIAMWLLPAGRSVKKCKHHDRSQEIRARPLACDGCATRESRAEQPSPLTQLLKHR